MERKQVKLTAGWMNFGVISKNSADDSDDDDDEKEEMFGGNEEKVQLFAEEAWLSPEKFVVLAEAAENYLGIVLNDPASARKR